MAFLKKIQCFSLTLSLQISCTFHLWPHNFYICLLFFLSEIITRSWIGQVEASLLSLSSCGTVNEEYRRKRAEESR